MSLLPTTVVESRTPTTSSFDVLKRVCVIITSLVILVCFLVLLGQIVMRLGKLGWDDEMDDYEYDPIASCSRSTTLLRLLVLYLIYVQGG